MYFKRIIIFFILCLVAMQLPAQALTPKELAEQQSLTYFYAEQWPELLKYGKKTIRTGIDYPILRMRTGYAALMQGNYSESLKHYRKAYHQDKKDATALYYTYLTEVYLDNSSASRFYASKMLKADRKTLKLKQFGVANAGLLYSFKKPSLSTRNNANYYSAMVTVNLGYRFTLQQVVGYFDQTISETQFLYVTDNQNIEIKQKEYYAKLNFAVTGSLDIMGGYHYIKTPFNNYSYNNQLYFGCVRYTLPYIQLQAMMHSGTLSDTAYQQYDVSVKVNPTGNTNLYTITRGAYGNEFVFTQIAGMKVMKNTWLEANITLGKYKVLLDNDDLFLFNDIDTKKFKAGGTAYYLIAHKLLVSLNYIFETKQKYGATKGSLFNQYSITTGIIWNF